MIWQLQTHPADNQPNFTRSIDVSSESKPTSSGSIEISYPVPLGQAKGEYALTGLVASVPSLGISLNYDSSELPPRKLTITNSTTFEKPKVKDIKVSGS